MAATANWRCADCDIVNKPAERACTICGSTRRAPASAPAAAPPRKSAPRPTARRPSPAKPRAEWRCTKCDTNNGEEDTSCRACDTSWKAATKPAAKPAVKKSPPTSAEPASGGSAKPAPKKPAPKKRTPKKTTPSSASAAKKTASKRPAPGRPSSAGSAGSMRATSSARPESLFHPPPTAATGYTPTAPRRPTPPPRPFPRPRRSSPPAPAKKGNGCASCLGALVMGTLLLVVGKSCVSATDSDSSRPDDSDTGRSTTASCPTRIADELPSGDGAELVEAFRTGNKQITLCRTAGGKLFYFGEFSDQREPGIAMPAERTSDGYEASNPPYRYDIHDGVVTIYKSGTRLGQEELTEEPSPR
ncbi:hypothetical protein [Streptomyces sp. NPDC003032]